MTFGLSNGVKIWEVLYKQKVATASRRHYFVFLLN